MKIQRIKFLQGQQSKFLAEVSKSSGLTNEKIAIMVGVHPRSLRDWKREKLTMPLLIARFLCKEYAVSLPEDEQLLVCRWEKGQAEANKIGGKARYAKYGSPATVEGRRKGGVAALANLRTRGIVPRVKIFQLPQGYSPELAEFVGILLGDGGITPSQITVTLNSEKDNEYSKYVTDLGKSLFGDEPKVFLRKNEKTLVLYYNGASLVRYLLTIGLLTGNKIRQQVAVPGWVNTSMEYRKKCLRGLMDTDGGVFQHKYTVKGKEYKYKKLAFTNKSLPLLEFVRVTLKDMGFNPKVIDKVENKKVWLYNMQEVERYLVTVGTSNHRLLHLNGG